ncbi:(R)-mandelonitrile lyase [Aestuariimicrobium ganziense]|uniref:(R)-mandelonitrile lyase n=1 Tax=Aestuariimicrobium ganziense TaxID=2773677 RepID=UPI0019422922|nr:cupin domain-containing protein [Aestuariimicrobium ganziense]
MLKLPKSTTTHAPAELFTGDVYHDEIALGVAASPLRVMLVRFTPGARTAWHSHVNGQTLHCTDGVGYVGTRDGRVVELRPGDTVWTPPGEWHWHGAAPDKFMSHLAIWEGCGPDQTDQDESEWAEHVTDEDYLAAREASSATD